MKNDIRKRNIAVFLLLMPLLLSFLPMIWYESNDKVDWYLFSDNKRYLTNVIEDYADIIAFILIYFVGVIAIRNKWIQSAALFMFVLSCLDLAHLALFDMAIIYWFPKLLITFVVWKHLERFTIFLT